MGAHAAGVRGIMEPEYFVKALGKHCRDAGVEGCLEDFESPPGRKPDPRLVHMSEWFKSLSPSDRDMVAKAMQEAADATLHGVLCVLDGVRPIESGSEKSRFQLIAQKGAEQSIICPGGEELHVLKQSL
tara:strand:- start:755 stop:1141 length:387 start_codon:yes stop_codon:yes gene_type:complete